MEKYVRKPSIEMIPKSVLIEKSHQDFLSENQLNLSAIVRDAIDALIAATKKRGEGA